VARSAERCLCRLSASLRIRARSASAAVRFTSVASISTRDADSETGKETEKAAIEGYVRAVAGCFADVRFRDAREGPSAPVPATVCSRGRAMRHLGNRQSGGFPGARGRRGLAAARAMPRIEARTVGPRDEAKDLQNRSFCSALGRTRTCGLLIRSDRFGGSLDPRWTPLGPYLRALGSWKMSLDRHEPSSTRAQ
jgi:hypothetical protein